MSSAPISLDPHLTNETVAFAVNSNIYETLVQTDANLRLQPSLAWQWINPDNLSWSLDLLPDARFHDGTPLTSTDVAFSLMRARNDPRSEWRATLEPMARVETPSPHQVVVHTTRPSPTLLRSLAGIAIVPKAHVETAGPSALASMPVGSGPYRFVARNAQSVVLTRWVGHRRPPPPIGHVSFVSIPDDRQKVAAFLSGAVDMITDVPPASIARLRGRDGIRILQAPALRELFLAFDVWRRRTPYASPERNPFLDRRVRLAFLQSIDTRRIVREILPGAAEEASQLAAPPVFGFNPRYRPPSYDLESARRLMASAGLDGGFSVTLDAPRGAYPGDAQIADFVVESLRAINVTVEARKLEKARLFEKIAARDTSFYMLSWDCLSGDIGEVFFFLLHTPDPVRGYGGDNAGGYSNAAADRLFEETDQIVDPATRLERLQTAVTLVMEDVPWVPIYVQHQVYALRSPFRWTPRPDKRIRADEIALAGGAER